jgi:MFS family permease
LGWGLEFFDLQLLSLYGPDIMNTMGITKAQFGSIATTQLLATALGGIFFGWLADIYGRKRTLMWTILLFSISTALVIFASNLATLYVLRFLTGMGVGGEWAIGFSLLNEAWQPKRRGLMGGIVQAALWPGYAAAIFVNQFVHDWRWGFAIGALPALAAFWVRYNVPESKVWLQYQELKKKGTLPAELKQVSERTPLVQIFKKDVIKHTILGTLIVLGGQYAYYVISSWMPTLLVDTYKLNPTDKANTLYLGAAIALFSYILAGGLSDKFGRKKVFFSFIIVCLLSFIGFAAVNLTGAGFGALILTYIIFNLGIGFFGIFGIWFGELFPTRIRATGSSFCYNVGRGLASFAPLVAGMIAGSQNLGMGMSTGLFAIILVLVVVPFMVERKGREITYID